MLCKEVKEKIILLFCFINVRDNKKSKEKEKKKAFFVPDLFMITTFIKMVINLRYFECYSDGMVVIMVMVIKTTFEAPCR